MFALNILLNPCTLAVSLCTATGVFVHDMQLDKAAVTAISHAVAAPYEAGSLQTGASHTHVERSSLQSVHDLRSATPRMLPRDDHRKHVLSKRVVKGVHVFDGYYLPEPVLA